MEKPVEIMFEGLAPSTFIEKRVRAEAAKFERFFSRIISCRVVIFLPHHRHRSGNLYGVKVFLGLPGGRAISVERSPDLAAAHRDVYVAIRDAFKAARRQLQDEARKMGGRVKTLRKPARRRRES